MKQAKAAWNSGSEKKLDNFLVSFVSFCTNRPGGVELTEGNEVNEEGQECHMKQAEAAWNSGSDKEFENFFVPFVSFCTNWPGGVELTENELNEGPRTPYETG